MLSVDKPMCVEVSPTVAPADQVPKLWRIASTQRQSWGRGVIVNPGKFVYGNTFHMCNAASTQMCWLARQVKKTACTLEFTCGRKHSCNEIEMCHKHNPWLLNLYYCINSVIQYFLCLLHEVLRRIELPIDKFIQGWIVFIFRAIQRES